MNCAIKNLSPADVKEMLDEKSILLIDVREEQEYAEEHIEGAVLFPLSLFDPQDLPEPAAGQTVVFHCLGGMRSAAAFAKCQQAGLPYNAHLDGGLKAWVQAGLPTR